RARRAVPRADARRPRRRERHLRRAAHRRRARVRLRLPARALRSLPGGGPALMEDLLFEVRGEGIAWLTFNRPDARNAMTFAMYQRLGEICRTLDPRVRVLILRGAGDKAFVAGTDIAQFRSFTLPEQAVEYEKMMDGVFDALEEVKVPTIAAIQGACTGGGA